jgi:hypothetical protein
LLGKGREKRARRWAVPVLNGVWRWGMGRRGGSTGRELRRGPGAAIGGDAGVPLVHVPVGTGES